MEITQEWPFFFFIAFLFLFDAVPLYQSSLAVRKKMTETPIETFTRLARSNKSTRDIKFGVPVVFTWGLGFLALPVKLCELSTIICFSAWVNASSVVVDENVGKGKIVIPSSPSFRDFYHLCKIFRR